MPAADLTAVLDPGGILRVEGTDQSDVIRVVHRDGSVSVDGAPILLAQADGSAVGSVDRDLVARVVVRAGSGDDTVILDDSPAGADRHVLAEVFGDDGADVVYGGKAGESLTGGAGADTLYGGPGADHLLGGGDDDSLNGDDGTDRLDGQAGDDLLRGGAADDKLYGSDGADELWGEDGADWLDAGSAPEVADGGAGLDFNAHVWTVGGADWTDVRQGDGPTCWLNASMASAALHGVDFNTRITYLGQDQFAVGLYNTAGLWRTEVVRFSGVLLGADTDLDPGQEGEFWHVLVQRAFLESRGLSVHNPPPNTAGDALRAFTGRPTTWTGRVFGGNLTAGHLHTLAAAVAAGRNVVADTRDTAAQLTTGLLVPWHMYTVTAVTQANGQWVVTLRNPWGTDSDGPAWGDAGDGIVQLSWADFSRSMDGFYVN